MCSSVGRRLNWRPKHIVLSPNMSLLQTASQQWNDCLLSFLLMPSLAIKFLVPYIRLPQGKLFCRMPKAECSVCLRLVSTILLKGHYYIVLRLFQQIKANRKKIWAKLTAAKQSIWCSSVFSKVLALWAWAICVYILNTPNLGSPIGAFKAELKLSPRTVRVSTGSMTPSSHNLQEQQKEWAVFYCQYSFSITMINMETTK